MAETDPPSPIVEGPSEVAPARRISVVWLIPLVALVVSLAIAWRTYNSRGPLIEIVFDNAAGIEAGKTAIRFRDVTIGAVESVDLSPDLSRVVVSARINKSFSGNLDTDARFWVVRPSITSQGISGLDTVVSGAYIDSSWDDSRGEWTDHFTALPSAPLTPAGQPGTRVRLRAPGGGSMVVGAPVLFKQIQVGRIETINLTPAGDVMIDIFVNAPNNARLTEGARFWNASGFNISLGPSGAELNVASLLSLVQGGVAFDTVGPDSEKVDVGHVFQLYDTEADARRNIFETDTGLQMTFTTYFDGSVRGLAPGAQVEFHGLRVGQVTAVQATILEDDRAPRVAVQATLSIVPRRMGVAEGTDAEMSSGLLDLLQSEVERGMRARLAASGLLSQTLFVDLGMPVNPLPGDLNRDAEPFPIIPSAPSDTTALTASTQGLMQRLSNLPIEGLMTTVQNLLANVNAIVSDPGVRRAPENLGLLIADVRKVIADPGIQEAPQQLAAILGATENVVNQVERQRLVERLGTALDATSTAVASIGAASDSVPKVVARIDALAGRIDALPLEELVASGDQLVSSVDALVRSQGVTEIPGNLNASLDEVRGLLSELRRSGVVSEAAASMTSLRQISSELAAADLAAKIQILATLATAAVGNVNIATGQLPELVQNLADLSERANSLPIDQLADQASRLLVDLDALIGTEGARQLPAALSGSLEEVRATLAELRAGGAVANVNSTLASTGRAADAITRSAEDLPALITQLSETARRADAALAGLEPNSPVNRETLALLRQLSGTAKSINDLVGAFQRQPNSVIFGR